MNYIISHQRREISGHSNVQKISYAFLWAGLLIFSFRPDAYGQADNTKTAEQSELYGGIEISRDGIKAIVIRLTDTEQGYDVKIVHSEAINVRSIQVGRLGIGKLTPEAIKSAGQAVQQLYTQMQQQYKVSRERIYIIGSNDLKADNQKELVDEISDKTGKTVTFLSAMAEARLSVIGTIPKRYREGETWFDNRSLSVLIDIGSSRTKGGYQQIRQLLSGNTHYDFVALGIPRGAVNFAYEVSYAVGENVELKKFAFVARMFGEGTIRTDLRGQLRNELESKPGLAYRKKVYLSGGIAWAVATSLYPEDRRSFVPITVDDIRLFHQRAVNSPQALLHPGLSRIRDGEIRKELERELEAMRSNFTPESLIAGAEILKAVANEYNFEGEGKKILFARYGHLSLILSYVRLQAENGPQP
jgi:hypothetical protein